MICPIEQKLGWILLIVLLIGCLLVLPLNSVSTGIGSFVTFAEIVFNFRVTPTLMAAGVGFATFAVAGVVAVVAVVALSVLCYKLVIEPVRQHDAAVLIATIALGLPPWSPAPLTGR